MGRLKIRPAILALDPGRVVELLLLFPPSWPCSIMATSHPPSSADPLVLGLLGRPCCVAVAAQACCVAYCRFAIAIKHSVLPGCGFWQNGGPIGLRPEFDFWACHFSVAIAAEVLWHPFCVTLCVRLNTRFKGV